MCIRDRVGVVVAVVVAVVAVVVMVVVVVVVVSSSRSRSRSRSRGGSGSCICRVVIVFAQPIKFREDGTRPGLTHQIVTRWAAVRPSLSHFQISRPGPAHQIFKSLGPACHNFEIGPARPRYTAHDKP